jgi:3-isopropylmalate/(R)-2-methylmalate dehydratase small subunit
VISPRFGDIFRNNATKSGLLPVEVDPEVGAALLEAVAADPGLEITIDVERGTLSAPAAGVEAVFPLDEHTRYRLLNGLDDIGLSLVHAGRIDAFEDRRPAWLPSVSG